MIYIDNHPKFCSLIVKMGDLMYRISELSLTMGERNLGKYKEGSDEMLCAASLAPTIGKNCLGEYQAQARSQSSVKKRPADS
jgi:hypothetical protein